MARLATDGHRPTDDDTDLVITDPDAMERSKLAVLAESRTDSVLRWQELVYGTGLAVPRGLALDACLELLAALEEGETWAARW